MAKSDASKKTNKPTSSSSTIRNTEPSIVTRNYRAVFQDHDHYDVAIKHIIRYMLSHPLFNAFVSVVEIVPHSVIYRCVFSIYHPTQDPEQIHLKLANDFATILSKKKFLDAINLRVPTKAMFKSPTNTYVFKDFYKKEYQEKLKGVAYFKKGKFPDVWVVPM